MHLLLLDLKHAAKGMTTESEILQGMGCIILKQQRYMPEHCLFSKDILTLYDQKLGSDAHEFRKIPLLVDGMRGLETQHMTDWKSKSTGLGLVPQDKTVVRPAVKNRQIVLIYWDCQSCGASLNHL